MEKHHLPKLDKDEYVLLIQALEFYGDKITGRRSSFNEEHFRRLEIMKNTRDLAHKIDLYTEVLIEEIQ